MGRADSVYQLSYAKKDSKILIPKIYFDEKSPYLRRKYEKLQNFLIIDNKENERVMKSADICV